MRIKENFVKLSKSFKLMLLKMLYLFMKIMFDILTKILWESPTFFKKWEWVAHWVANESMCDLNILCVNFTWMYLYSHIWKRLYVLQQETQHVQGVKSHVHNPYMGCTGLSLTLLHCPRALALSLCLCPKYASDARKQPVVMYEVVQSEMSQPSAAAISSNSLCVTLLPSEYIEQAATTQMS